jgi:hypothetical protein
MSYVIAYLTQPEAVHVLEQVLTRRNIVTHAMGENVSSHGLSRTGMLTPNRCAVMHRPHRASRPIAPARQAPTDLLMHPACSVKRPCDPVKHPRGCCAVMMMARGMQEAARAAKRAALAAQRRAEARAARTAILLAAEQKGHVQARAAHGRPLPRCGA